MYAAVLDFVSPKNSSIIFRLCKRSIKESTGDIKAKCGYQNGYSRKLIKDKAEFLEFMKINEGRSIQEIGELMPNRMSSSTIKRALKSFNYTYKKNLLSPQEGYSSKREVLGRDNLNSTRKASIS